MTKTTECLQFFCDRKDEMSTIQKKGGRITMQGISRRKETPHTVCIVQNITIVYYNDVLKIKKSSDYFSWLQS